MSGMDIRLIRAFVAVAEHGSYHKAAEVLHLTQPALSKQIQALEQQIGGNLFQRGRHGAALSELGHQLYSSANELLEQHHRFLLYAQDIQKKSHERLCIGFGISSFNNVPAWINTFQSQQPDTEISVSHIPSSVQCNLLVTRELHIGFVRLPATESLNSLLIKRENLRLAVPSDKNLQQKSVLDLLLSNSILQMNPTQSSCLAEQTALYLQKNGIITQPLSVTDDIHALLALVAAGNGVALLPESVRHFLPAGVELRHPETSLASWNIGMVWNPQLNHTRRDKFIKMVKEALNQPIEEANSQPI